MRSDSDILELFREHGALLDGHFLLSSGLHSGKYLQCALILQWPDVALKLGAQLAEKLRPFDPTVIVSPALGGIFVGQEVARAFGVRSVFTERTEGEMTLRRGFRLAQGERAIVVEDVITTGKSTRETMDAVEAQGARVVAAGALIDRSGGTAMPDVSVVALATLAVPAFSPSECPLCAEGRTLVKPGSRTSPNLKR